MKSSCQITKTSLSTSTLTSNTITTTSAAPVSSTSAFNIANPIINSINSTCQTLFTITKTVSSSEQHEEKPVGSCKPLKFIQSNFMTRTKKPFVFNHSSCSPNDQDIFKVNSHPVYSRPSSHNLLSPCQALENFNFNSPKVEKSVQELFPAETSSSAKQQQSLSLSSSSSSEDSNSNENSQPLSYSSVKFRNNSDQEKLKYIPKSFTIEGLNDSETTNSFKLCLSRKITTNYKRTATEKLEIEQENCNDNKKNDNLSLSPSSSTSTSTVESLHDSKQHKPQQTLARPSSIFLNRQHLLPIKETNPNIQLQPFFPPASSSSSSSSSASSTTSSSISSTSPYSHDLQLDLHNKKMRLSPITDINPIHSNSQLHQSKSSENLIKSVNNDASSILNSFCFHKSQSTNLNVTESPELRSSFDTLKNVFDANMKNNSTKSSKSSLHDSVEKMIEVS